MVTLFIERTCCESEVGSRSHFANTYPRLPFARPPGEFVGRISPGAEAPGYVRSPSGRETKESSRRTPTKKHAIDIY